MTYKPTFTEREIAVIQRALIYFWDSNLHFTQQEFKAVQDALIAIEDAL